MGIILDYGRARGMGYRESQIQACDGACIHSGTVNWRGRTLLLLFHSSLRQAVEEAFFLVVPSIFVINSFIALNDTVVHVPINSSLRILFHGCVMLSGCMYGLL